MAITAHGTLTADEVTTVEIDAGYSSLEIVNRDMQGAIWVRYDGEDPEIAGSGSFVVLGARTLSVGRRRSATLVKLVSDADRSYSVEVS